MCMCVFTGAHLDSTVGSLPWTRLDAHFQSFDTKVAELVRARQQICRITGELGARGLWSSGQRWMKKRDNHKYFHKSTTPVASLTKSWGSSGLVSNPVPRAACARAERTALGCWGNLWSLIAQRFGNTSIRVYDLDEFRRA